MQWYYERDGQQVGPVSQAELIRLMIQRVIQPQTLVWHPAFGNEWRPASRAGLALPAGDVKIFSLTLGRSKSASAVVDETRKKVGKVPSFWAWVLLLPSFLDLVILFASQKLHWAVNPGSVLTGSCLYALILLAIVQDKRAIEHAGGKPPSLWWWVFIPGYFWCRWRAIGRGLVLFLLSVMITLCASTILITDPPPGFPHITFQAPAVKAPISVSPEGEKSLAPSGSQAGSIEDSKQEKDVQL